jgi:hypothetical protein
VKSRALLRATALAPATNLVASGCTGIETAGKAGPALVTSATAATAYACDRPGSPNAVCNRFLRAAIGEKRHGNAMIYRF